ncbi:MAG TPA: PAS domain S-box protein, partial [Candidatus Limnocylindrales bacterium]|nr:PAS domain S-box protein [Candidatus Limnocylindrales bacterium]
MSSPATRLAPSQVHQSIGASGWVLSAFALTIFVDWALHVSFLAGVAALNPRWEAAFSLAVVLASVMLYLMLLIIRNAARADREAIALRESEKRFRVIANAAPVMIWISGTDKLCNYFNDPWLKFTGRTLEAETGNGWADGVHPDDISSCMQTYLGAFDGRESFQMQYRLRRHDGQYRWVLHNGVPRFSDDGYFAGYFGSCIDITDSKLAEKALAEMGHKLIEAEENERRWIARELHDDINQRIAALAFELERWGEDLSASATEFHNFVSQFVQQLSHLGTDIQSLSHHLHSSRLEYLGLVAAADSFCRELAQNHKLEIDFIHDTLPEIPREIAL